MHALRHSALCVLLLALTLGLAAPALCAQQSLDNDAVIKLAKSGLSEDIVAQTIAASPGHFDTGVNALIALKQAGVSDKEIGAMIAKNAGPAATPSQMPPTVIMEGPPPTLPGVSDVGVYFKDHSGSWVAVDSENVNFKTGGVLKSAFSEGIVKPDLNGHLTGPASKLKLNTPLQFAIYVFEGQSAGDYQLLHLHTHKDGREFRSVTGGVFHQSSGAERDTVDFESNKVGPHTYLVTVQGTLESGEYGFLPPGTINNGRSLASLGKMYTFTLTE